jgi:hypothetical protein
MPAQILSWAYRNSHFKILVGLGQYDEGPQILVAASTKGSYEEAGSIGYFRERGQPKPGTKATALLAHCRSSLVVEMEALLHVTTQQMVQEMCHIHASRGSLGFSPDREPVDPAEWASKGDEEYEESPDEEYYGPAAPAARSRGRTKAGKQDKTEDPKPPKKSQSRQHTKAKDDEDPGDYLEDLAAAPAHRRPRKAGQPKAKKAKFKPPRLPQTGGRAAASSSDNDEVEEEATDTAEEATDQEDVPMRCGYKEKYTAGKKSGSRKRKGDTATKEAAKKDKYKENKAVGKRRRK